MSPPEGPRKSAEERREDILAIALEHFALGGYHGTSTETIAREAGISQPYLFRLFRTKRELFLACNERHHRYLEDVFRRAAETAPEGEKLAAMGRAYTEELLPRTVASWGSPAVRKASGISSGTPGSFQTKIPGSRSS